MWSNWAANALTCGKANQSRALDLPFHPGIKILGTVTVGCNAFDLWKNLVVGGNNTASFDCVY